jgi:hypothetical protein
MRLASPPGYDYLHEGIDVFDPAHCLALIERHKVTHAQFVPTPCSRGCCANGTGPGTARW